MHTTFTLPPESGPNSLVDAISHVHRISRIKIVRIKVKLLEFQQSTTYLPTEYTQRNACICNVYTHVCTITQMTEPRSETFQN